MRIWAQKFLNLLNPRPSFRESGAAVADDVYPGTKHNGASVSFLYLLEKMASKIDCSNMLTFILGLKRSSFV